MPDFPTYRGELPRCLDPRNPRHYLLLAYWIYFRPTALKAYLYQADPDLYRAGPGRHIFRTLRVPSYWKLYLMVPCVVLLLSVVVGLPVVLAASWVQGTPVDWGGWGRGMAVGMLYSGVAIGVVVSVTFGVASGVAAFVAFGVAFGGAIGVAGVMVFSMVLVVIFGVASGVAFGVGALRGVFYPFQLLPALHSLRGSGRHPLAWDELAVLPLPGTRRVLVDRLRQDAADGLCFVGHVACNPYQRWVAQAALHAHLHACESPVQLLYRLLAIPDLDACVFAPTSKLDWRSLPSVRQVLLGELDGRWVECSFDSANRFSERLVWALTRLLRDRRRTPLTRFAGMLYELLDEEAIEQEEFDLAAYADVYTGLDSYPGGVEIAHTFAAMAEFLAYDDLLDLPAAVGRNAVPSYDDPIRPTVLAALNRLGQVGAEVAAYRDATSRVNQLAALARAADALDGLDGYASAEVMAPEQTILRRVIRRWRRLVSEAGGATGRLVEAGPVANPYVAGNPVEGYLFVGREDVMRRLEELWVGEGQKPSVVLYGHRRMGKSSILHNLGARFGSGTVIVDFNMQRVGLVASTGELLYNLALALYDSLPDQQAGLGEPDAARFTDHNPYTAFDRFLRRLDRARGDCRFIVTVDEFELIEEAIEEGQLEPHLLAFWRGLIQTYPWFVMAFAGLHTLQEMTRDYWHPLYGSVIGIPVSFLCREAARRLITQPTPEFSLDYDREAIESIVALTNGQPYLVQLIGHGLVTRFNRQAFEEDVERERRFSLADVGAVIGAPEFYRDGDAYFTGVWRQAETSEPAGQTAVLHALAPSEAGLPLESIVGQTGVDLKVVEGALDALSRHDVVMEKDGGWRFTVELMRRWVQRREED
jgi:hypothetical protein